MSPKEIDSTDPELINLNASLLSHNVSSKQFHHYSEISMENNLRQNISERLGAIVAIFPITAE